MFSKEYLNNLSAKTGFRIDGLQKQMTLLDILREIARHPMLSRQFALKGGTALNLFWFKLPRLSVDIDFNYTGNVEREAMLAERPKLETELKKLIQSRGISVEHAPLGDHAGGKWRLRAPNALGGNFSLELDLNYLMRVPLWDIEPRKAYVLDEDYSFECPTVSMAELFAGKIKALLERTAARDLYDLDSLSAQIQPADKNKLKKGLILFGITTDEDWRKKDYRTLDVIDQHMIDQDLTPLLRADEKPSLKKMKQHVRELLTELMTYEKSEKRFLNRFLDEGIYEPELLFGDTPEAQRMRSHPAVLWKLQHHRKHFGLGE